jgi:hypothetical protein
VKRVVHFRSIWLGRGRHAVRGQARNAWTGAQCVDRRAMRGQVSPQSKERNAWTGFPTIEGAQFGEQLSTTGVLAGVRGRVDASRPQ